MPDQPTTVLCANEHLRPVPAVARLSWPDGPYRPTTACVTDMRLMISTARTEGRALIVEIFADPAKATD